MKTNRLFRPDGSPSEIDQNLAALLLDELNWRKAEREAAKILKTAMLAVCVNAGEPPPPQNWDGDVELLGLLLDLDIAERRRELVIITKTIDFVTAAQIRIAARN